ncbi:transcription antitermination protein NusB [bacterium]|nr:transcription antitermination protein NusB [bacterium]
MTSLAQASTGAAPETDLPVADFAAALRQTNDLPASDKPDYTSRHRERMHMVQALFIDEFEHQSWADADFAYDPQLLADIRAHKAEYDTQIRSVATKRPLSELAKIDLSILRLILHEHATKDTPDKVLIDEGVELAKDFGGENSYAFINAVLEKLILGSPAHPDETESHHESTGT